MAFLASWSIIKSNATDRPGSEINYSIITKLEIVNVTAINHDFGYSESIATCYRGFDALIYYKILILKLKLL